MDHRHDGRDADAARDEQIAGRTLGERKVVGGGRHAQLGAGRHVADQAGGTATAIRLALDRDDVAVALRRVVAERILAKEPARNLDRDMRAGGKFRQVGAAGIPQLEHMDVLGDALGARHAHRDHHEFRTGHGHPLLSGFLTVLRGLMIGPQARWRFFRIAQKAAENLDFRPPSALS